MKCVTPAFEGVSSREPAPIQKPSETERTLGIRSVITRWPESSSLRTYFCTARMVVQWPRSPGNFALGQASKPADVSRGLLLIVIASIAVTGCSPGQMSLTKLPREDPDQQGRVEEA